MNKVLTIVAFILVCFTQLNAQSQMQQEFEDFIAKFPKKEWSDLKAIQRLKIDDLKNYTKLSVTEANRNIWYEEPQFGPENVYNHVKKEYEIIDFKWTLSAPVIMLSDGKYKTCYRRNLIGVYTDMYSEEEIYAVARLEPFDDVVMLVVGYKYKNIDCNCYVYAIDLYSFKCSTQQMCSAVEILSSTYPFSLLLDNYTIHSFEVYESMEDDECERYVYRFESDGFLHQIDAVKNIDIPFVKVSDPDGYVNVRKEPNLQSEIIYTIPDGTDLRVWYIPNSDWAEIIKGLVRKNGEIVDRPVLGGYVHKSRLKE